METRLCRVFTATSSLSVRHHSRTSTRCLLSPRYLHTTQTKEATPVPHPTVPGPPPQAPQAAATYPEDRVARKQRQAEALRQSQEAKVNPAKPTSALQKRFWKNVSVKETDDALQIHLDARPVRTAVKRVLNLPKSKRALAAAIGLEWDQLVSAQQALKQHYIPLTSHVNRTLDSQDGDAQEGPSNKVRQRIVTTMMRYLGTDTLLCWDPVKNAYGPNQPGVTPLRQKQKDIAEPIIAFLTTHVFPGVEIVPILGEDSIVPVSQPEITRQVIRGWITGLPPFELAALERGTLATKSFLVSARLLVEWSREFAHLRDAGNARSEGANVEIEPARFNVENAAEAANMEVQFQTQMWGEVEDTHDVEREDLRRQLGSVILLVS